MRTTPKIVGTALLAITQSLAQSRPTTQQQAGDCSINEVGSHNQVTVNCQGIPKELGVEIVKLLKRNQSNAKATLAKTEECLQEVKDLGEQQTKRFDEYAIRLTKISDAVEGLSLTPQKLLAKYPLGYVIFDVDHRNDVFPYRSKAFLDKFDLDWSAVRVEPIPCPAPGTTCQPNEIALTLPDVGLKNQPKAFTTLAMVGLKEVGPLQHGAVVNDLKIQAEILAVRDDGIVFLIGLKELAWNWPFPKPF